MTAAAILPEGARAIMAGRREPPDSLDFFPTPPWATRALLKHVLPRALNGLHIASAWDPCCGEGHMSEVLAEDIAIVKASDVFDYGRGYVRADFLDPGTTLRPPPDLIGFNPPFKIALPFVLRALELTGGAVAALVRTSWIEGVERYTDLFSVRPPRLFAPFVERVPMTKGRWDPNASTATAYAWFVWVVGAEPMAPFWIPPGCRRSLTRPDDIERFALKTADTAAPLFGAE